MEFLQFAHRGRRIDVVLGDLDHLGDLVFDVAMTRPQAFTVEHAESAEASELDGRLWRHQRIGRMAQDRRVETVRVELPGGRHLFRRTRPAGRNDVDVAEFECPPGSPAHADIHKIAHVWCLSRCRCASHSRDAAS